jgi:hypothetical protein
MCCTATYYFNSDEEEEGTAEVFLSLSWTHINHMGSICFGSIICALV